MAQKIEYSDNLKKGTDKLNESIEQSNAASQKAITAEQTANQAIQQSESTQTQLDNIVIEGDSSVEAAQARVDSKGESFPTLKSRLDNFEVSATQQLQQTEQSLNAQLAQIPKLVGTDFEYKGVAFEKVKPHNGWAYSKYKWDDSTKEVVSLQFEGTYHGSWDGVIYFRRKPKYGVFSEPSVVADFTADGIGCTCQAFEIAQNGDYVALISKMETGTAKSLGTWIYRSTDKGVTWVEESQLIVDGKPIIALTGDVTNLYRLRSGRLISWGWYLHKETFALYSDDNGTTFHFGSIGGGATAFEPAFCELSDGTIVALLRNDLGSTTKKPALFSKSEDGGLSWSAPVESNTILDMTDNNGVFIQREGSNVIEFVNCSRLVQSDGYKSIYQSVFTEEQAKNGDFGTQNRIFRISGSADFGYPAALIDDENNVELYFYTGTYDNGTICYFTGSINTPYFEQTKSYDALTGEVKDGMASYVQKSNPKLFDQGGFNGGVTGLPDVLVEPLNRIRSKDFLTVEGNQYYYLEADNDFEVVVRQYADSDICIFDSGWLSNTLFKTLSNTQKMKLVIRRKGDGILSPKDITDSTYVIKEVSLRTELMLYKGGYEEYRMTGGWIDGLDEGNGSKNKLGNKIELSATGTSSVSSKRSYTISNGIDVTNLTTISCLVNIASINGNADIALPIYNKKNPSSPLDGRLSYTKTQTMGLSVINVHVGNLTGVVYPFVTASTPQVSSSVSCEIYEVWAQ